jgi:hypothetical protein
MDFQFEIPRSNRFKLLFMVAVILAITRWPLLQRVMGIVLPDLNPGNRSADSSWDLPAM